MQVLENLRNIQHAPGVQMHEVPFLSCKLIPFCLFGSYACFEVFNADDSRPSIGSSRQLSAGV